MTTKTKQLHVLLSPELYNSSAELAKTQGVSLTKFVAAALELYGKYVQADSEDKSQTEFPSLLDLYIRRLEIEMEKMVDAFRNSPELSRLAEEVEVQEHIGSVSDELN